MNSDFNSVASKIIDGNLTNVNFRKEASVCTYLVPNGYPLNPVKDEPLEIDPSVNEDIYYASVYRLKKDIKTTSSRAIALVTTGENLENAKELNEQKISKIKGNLFFRKDIGTLL
jgi:phosphoribosylamine--glycine ligase